MKKVHVEGGFCSCSNKIWILHVLLLWSSEWSTATDLKSLSSHTFVTVYSITQLNPSSNWTKVQNYALGFSNMASWTAKAVTYQSGVFIMFCTTVPQLGHLGGGQLALPSSKTSFSQMARLPPKADMKEKLVGNERLFRSKTILSLVEWWCAISQNQYSTQ